MTAESISVSSKTTLMGRLIPGPRKNPAAGVQCVPPPSRLAETTRRRRWPQGLESRPATRRSRPRGGHAAHRARECVRAPIKWKLPCSKMASRVSVVILSSFAVRRDAHIAVPSRSSVASFDRTGLGKSGEGAGGHLGSSRRFAAVASAATSKRVAIP